MRAPNSESHTLNFSPQTPSPNPSISEPSGTLPTPDDPPTTTLLPQTPNPEPKLQPLGVGGVRRARASQVHGGGVPPCGRQVPCLARLVTEGELNSLFATKRLLCYHWIRMYVCYNCIFNMNNETDKCISKYLCIHSYVRTLPSWHDAANQVN